jgi:hypothetical protein
VASSGTEGPDGTAESQTTKLCATRLMLTNLQGGRHAASTAEEQSRATHACLWFLSIRDEQHKVPPFGSK